MPPETTTGKQDPFDVFFAKRDQKATPTSSIAAPTVDKADPFDAFFSARDAGVQQGKAEDAADVQNQAVANTKKLVLPKMEPSVIGKVASALMPPPLPGNTEHAQIPPANPQEAALLKAAESQPSELMNKIATGSRKMPLPAFSQPPSLEDFGPEGTLPKIRKSSVGELTDLTNEYLNRPDIPKTREQAFFAGVTKDAIQHD